MTTPRHLAALALLFVCATALAAVPQLITLQGLLRDGGGIPVADGDYSVAFTVYDSSVGGTVLWAETTMVSTTDGLFTVLLGSVHPVPDSVFNDSSRFLGIKVDADPEMTPRQRLASVGYSYVSSQWTSLGGDVYRLAGRVGIGESVPLATLHVRRMDMSLPASPALNNEDILVEDDDAILGLYSGTGGTYGSAIVFGEVDAGVYTNKWSIYRTKTAAGSRMSFAYGTDTSYALNPAHLTLDGPNARIGMGTIFPQNRLDVEGAVVVGAAYSGTLTAPGNGLLVQGSVGVGESSPLAGVHVQELDLSLPGGALTNDNVVIEDDDAVLGLYSGTGGTFGSAVVLGEIDAGAFTNKWSLYRTKTSNGSFLGFSYGGNANYGLNPTVATMDGPNARMGIGTGSPQNKLDVEGAATIGAGYSGTTTAPGNGLLVEGKVGIGTTSVYGDASTNLTLPGSIGFKNGTDPMMYVYETGSSNSSRAVIAHSPGFQDYGIAYNDSDDTFLFQNSGIPKMTVDLVGTVDVLAVAGNVSVGTGTTGCVKDADGTVIAGTCSSDRRFKTDIEPFADVLDRVVELEPVHFHWRADEYPDRDFGDRQSYGLIAQEVEKVMPELVTEDEEGFLAVRYSKLPLLLLQAVKEQQLQIELLRAEVASLRAEAAEARAENVK